MRLSQVGKKTRGRVARWVLALAAPVVMLASRDALAAPPNFNAVTWVPALLGGTPLNDPVGDTPGSRDIVGDAANPMLYVASDADHLYFRLRVNSDPAQSATNFKPFGWGCFMSTDGNSTNYEFSTIIDGVNNPDRIQFFKNTVTTTPNDPNDPPDLPALVTVNDPLAPAVLHARVVGAPSNFGGDADFFIDWAIDLVDVTPAQFDPSKPTKYYCGSSNNGSTIAADCSGGAASNCPLDSQFSDPVSCGASGCGICGDGATTGTEGCDDGNLVSGDGCNSVCLKELGQPCTASAQCASAFCDGNVCACDSNADCPTGQLCNTTPNPNTCVLPGCGNGVLEAGEACEDGNKTNGDGCNSVCLKELGQACTGSVQCASGFCDPAGSICACDGNNDCPTGQLCNTTPNPNVCVAPGCGNGVLEAGEGCDDGNKTAGDGCNASCLKELGQACTGSVQCASAFCDPAGNICACDGNNDCPSGQVCNTTPNPNVCVAPGCGNGVLDAGEGCDDGNLLAGDGCNAACLRELGQACTASAQCASAFCDPAGNTCACDGNNDCPTGQLCNTTPNPNVCVAPGCGNGVLEATEGCDDGNKTNGDGCNSVCLKELGQACAASAQCASGFCDPAGSVCACDGDADCPGTQICNTGANPNQCVAPGCGNSVLEAGEGCDDGNKTAGDGCNASCLKELGQACTGSAQCASGLCDPVSAVCACDDNGDCPAGQLCNTIADPNACVAPGCGNGVAEPTEGCDDGNLADGDGCNASCLRELGQACTASAQCASAFCDPAGNVCACDADADCPSGQQCNTTQNPNQCVPAGCGNGVVDATEGCDDGNTAPGDGCNAQCLRELGQACTLSAQCASAFCDPANNTCACDQDADCPSGQLCNTTPNPNSCVAPGCGNGVLEASEGCDDGNTTAGDGCNAACLLELGQACTDSVACASAFCDPSNQTCACDGDADCSAGQVCNTTPSPNVCVAAGCGNGVLEVGEICDDGNVAAGDGCDAACLLELGQPCTLSLQCASGFCDPTGGICACDGDSDCPNGQLCNTVSDPNSCVAPGCGNSVLEAGEGCDDGNLLAGDGCDSACLRELGQPCNTNPQCASSTCDGTATICVCDSDADCPSGEQCNTTLSPAQCVPAGCGNGVVDATEGCDDGNLVAGDGCNPQCLKELGQPCTALGQCASNFCDPTGNACACDGDSDCPNGQLCNTASDPNSCVAAGCGNSVVEAGEGCDDGNTTAGDGCSASCLIEIGNPCSDSVACESANCDATAKVCACDGDSDCPSGQQCNTALVPPQCVPAGCGNGVVDASEGCDDGNLATGDGCNAQCLRELGQTCAASAQCASGFCDPTGNLCACDGDGDCASGEVCRTTSDPNACVASGCGNGVLEAGEGCDDGNTTAGDNCDAACLIELGQPCTVSPSCASGFCDPTGNTCACDQDVDCPSGLLCNTTTDPNSCVAAGCGNNVLENTEGCDDGNTTAGDGCNDKCLLEIGQACLGSAQCASAFCDPSNNTCACDGDSDCPNGQLCNTTLDPNQCVPAGCGNGVVDAGEGCDDGNLVTGDGCNAQCLRELGQTCSDSPQCASGFCDPAGTICACDSNNDCPTGEVCNTGSDPNACVASGCGNAVVETNEGCDDGNKTAGDGCNDKCLIELGQPCTAGPLCASGTCDATAKVCVCDSDADCPTGQKCDTTKSPAQCVAAGCGNGVVDAGEGCDDGNTGVGDGCNAQCLIELGKPCSDSATCASGACDGTAKICVCDGNNDCPTGQICDTKKDPAACVASGCGNGVVEAGEGCDDGNKTNGDGCNDKCLIELGKPCTEGAKCSSQSCDPATKVCVCDADNDCPTGQICDTNADPNKCVAKGCGNGKLDMGEGCDDGNTKAGDGCSATCLIELGNPCTGDNGCVSGFCDPTGKTCTCNDDADCPSGQTCDTKSNPHKCVAVSCGDGKIQGKEACDDGNSKAGDGCSPTCTVEMGWTCANEPSSCKQTGCGSDADCPSGQTCDTATRTCKATGCKQDSDCTGGLVCDEAKAKCVGCVADADCKNGGTCNKTTQTCAAGAVAAGPVDPLAGAELEGGCACEAAGKGGNSSTPAAVGWGALLALVCARRVRRSRARA